MKNIQMVDLKSQYNSTHVFHQYTLKIVPELRNSLIDFFKENKIPVMIYYPVPLYKQEAFNGYVNSDLTIANMEQLCNTDIYPQLFTRHGDNLFLKA